MNNGKDENGNSLNAGDELTPEQIEEQRLKDEADRKEAEDSGDVEKLKELNKKLFERSKKAEDQRREARRKAKDLETELAGLRGTDGGKKSIKKDDVADPEELRLIAKGMSDIEIDKLKVLSKGLGITLNEAMKEEMFIAFQGKIKADKEKEDARIGASRGSGQAQEKQTFKPGMSDADHKKAWEESRKK